MFSRILVATDLSPASMEVVNCLGGLRTLGAKEAILVNCLNVRPIWPFVEQLKDFVGSGLETQKRMLEEQGFTTTVEIVPGVPHIEINRLATEKKCSIIVIGSHGHTLSSEILLGGVASEVIHHHASVPVLVIRLKIFEKNGQMVCEIGTRNFIEHILFPTDFSDNAEHAFTYVEKSVESGVKRVTLLHVQDRARIEKHLEHRLDEFNKIDKERLERLKAELQKKGATDVRIELPYGSPVREILKQARETGVSLIIMGSQGRGFISEVFLGSVSHNVARHAPVSVLLIPALR